MYRTSFVMAYALSFLAITATITHAILYFWKPIKIHFKRCLREQPDIHAQLMAQYKEGTLCFNYYCSLFNKTSWGLQSRNGGMDAYSVCPFIVRKMSMTLSWSAMKLSHLFLHVFVSRCGLRNCRSGPSLLLWRSVSATSRVHRFISILFDKS
jgi:hypothetical protein